MSHAAEQVADKLDAYLNAQRRFGENRRDPVMRPLIERLARDVTDARLKLVQALDRLARGKDDPAP